MNEQFSTSTFSSNWKFGLFKKWFCIGIVISIFNGLAGLVYGIALAVEKEHRKEGLIIIAFAIIWSIGAYYFILPWLMSFGVLPSFKCSLSR